jgi:hypothetical protein
MRAAVGLAVAWPDASVDDLMDAFALGYGKGLDGKTELDHCAKEPAYRRVRGAFGGGEGPRRLRAFVPPFAAVVRLDAQTFRVCVPMPSAGDEADGGR